MNLGNFDTDWESFGCPKQVAACARWFSDQVKRTFL
jgi:hypothetical protein